MTQILTTSEYHEITPPETPHENEIWGLTDPNLKLFPKEGIGRRAMACPRYDHCLHKAAVKDWETFNCEGCLYEKKGRADFLPSEFAPFEDEFDTTTIDAGEIGDLEMNCYKGFLSLFEEGGSGYVNPS